MDETVTIRRRLERRLFASLVLFVATLVLLLTGSRGASAWLACAVSVTCMFTCWRLRRELSPPA